MADAERPQSSEKPRPLPLPSLPREALKRIEAAEREAREQLNDDIWPYSSHNPKFSFLEESIIRSTARTRDFIRVYAEDILGVRLREHLDSDPSQLLRNDNLLVSLCDEVKSLADTAWEGYICGLQFEPSRRDAIFAISIAEGKKLPQWPVIPRQEQWNELLTKWEETDCKMRRVIDQFDPMIRNVLISQIRRYKKDAARKLGINESAEAGEPAQPEPPAVGAAVPGSPPQSETPAEKPKRPRSGRGRPRIEPTHQRKLVEIVDSHGGKSTLTDRDVLEQVCEELDKAAVPHPTTWPNNDPPARSWTRQRQNDPEIAHKTIAGRYRRFKQPQN